MSLSTLAAAPVEYVKICSLYGAGFYYIPGTDTCVNVNTGETRTQTEAGTWLGIAENTPAQWVPNPVAGCDGGKLVDFGAFTSADLTLNPYNRFETIPLSLTLNNGDYISNVMMKGGFVRTTLASANGVVEFTGVDGTFIPGGTELSRQDGVLYTTDVDGSIGDTDDGVLDVNATAEVAGTTGIMTVGTALTMTSPIDGIDTNILSISGFDTAAATPLPKSNFCLSFLDSTATNYSVLGCEDTAALVDQGATLSFTALRSSPPSSFSGTVSLVGDDQDWHGVNASSGSLSLSVCVRNVTDVGNGSGTEPSGCTVADNGSGATITCGGTSTTIHNGANGTNGADGANGTNGTNGSNGTSGTSCTVTDHGDGTATMHCPDGTSVDLLTTASGSSSSGCSSTSPDGGILVGLTAFGLFAFGARRRRAHASAV